MQESGLTVASTIGEAAGLQGRHQWGLILPSSARVSLLTYQTVVAVRYPGHRSRNCVLWKVLHC